MLYLIISTDQGLQSRLGTSTKMPVCLFVLQILWTRESREKVKAAIKAGLITLTRIIVMNVHGSKGVINQAQRQKLIASRLNLKHIKTRGPFRQLKHFKTSSSYGIELTRRMQQSKPNIAINKLV
ncbi:transposase [Lacticaseibacillus paracasei]|uniref:transposase n=1 Tax=Lacticaseibacillus paracasei TaxID=1597 RepID=UPI001FB69656|nr:transposase [Lacticaseibacillus paracasei]UOG14724.1 transposase [Lacticaseibacillus paracasei]